MSVVHREHKITTRVKFIMKKSVLVVIYPLILFASMPALSFNPLFLYDDAIRFFDEKDWKLVDETAVGALNGNPDGKTSKWINPKSGNSGSITPLKTYRNKQGQLCRKTKMFNRTKKKKSEYTFLVCKQSNNDWKIIN